MCMVLAQVFVRQVVGFRIDITNCFILAFIIEGGGGREEVEGGVPPGKSYHMQVVPRKGWGQSGEQVHRFWFVVVHLVIQR